MRYTRAYSGAPVCAVARSTLLTGVHAVAQGTQHMRSRYRIPAAYRPLPELLRRAGYYTSNRSKTDYNIAWPEGGDAQRWDACGRRAHYRKRPEGAPFFAVFNLTVSHESCLFPQRVARNRARGVIPEEPRVAPADVALPRSVPDLPAVRRDFAIYHDVMTALDARVGALLDELERDGLADDTIVFYFADHGGPTPRGKRYLTDSGVRVPLLVRVPPKWRALSPFAAGSACDEVVSFVDFAPTLLSLAGLAPPAAMQGRAFLGRHRVAPPEGQMALLYGDRFDEIFGMRRGITDGRWKYVRCFVPYRPAAPYSYYQFSMPSWSAMRDAAGAGRLSGYAASLWRAPQALEALFDLRADPDEVVNLAGDAALHARLVAMRAQLLERMTRVRDSGVVPEGLFAAIAGEGCLADALAADEERFARALRAMDLATGPRVPTRAELAALCARGDALEFYWALQAFLVHPELRHDAGLVRAALARAEAGPATQRVVAAEIHARLGRRERAARILLRVLEATADRANGRFAADTLTWLRLEAALSDAWLAEVLDDRAADPYVKRLAQRVQRSRAR